MDKKGTQGTEDASIKPARVSSLRSHFEALRPAAASREDSRRASPDALQPLDSEQSAVPIRASFDLPRPRSPWVSGDGGHLLPSTPLPEKGRSTSPPKSSHRRPMSTSMFVGSSPQLTPSVNIESPRSPPRSYFGRSSSRSPERADNTPFGKVRELISQHSSRASSRPTTPGAEEQDRAASNAARPPPVNRADKPKIPAIPPKPATLPTTIPVPEIQRGLVFDGRRPSQPRVSPFNTPPDSDDSPIATPAEPPSEGPVRSVRAIPSDSRALGFSRTATTAESEHTGAATFEARPQGHEPLSQPTRANTISDRPATRDARSLGFSTAQRPQQRHVSENVRSMSSSAQINYPPNTSSASGDARAFGFGAVASSLGPPLTEEPQSLAQSRPPTTLPPSRPPEESKGVPIRVTRQPSPVPDRTTKPSAPVPLHKIPASHISKAPPLPPDSKFPPPPKRHTDDIAKPSINSSVREERRGGPATEFASDSDEAEVSQEPISGNRNDYPDATNTNRRPPYHYSGLNKISVKSDSRAYDVCGKYVCIAGFTTKIFDMVTGEQLTGINHGDTVKATAVAFKPASDIANEGKRIWIGNSIGDLQEIDVLTHSIIAKNTSHNQQEIVRIIRNGRTLWTLDNDGKLFVWQADETGTPNLKYSHVSHKVQRGHTASLAARSKLWLATGKEVRVYDPGNESNFSVLLAKPLMQAGTGDITSGTCDDDGGRVCFGHTDGRVSIYSMIDYSCMKSVKASDYKINGLAMMGNDLWTAYKTGKIYIYDTSHSPWKVKKDWRAHDGPIVGLSLDPSSIWTMQRLQITSVGHDGQAKFWDGMLEQDWIETQMHERDVQYCTFRETRAAIVTWNCGAATPHELRTDFIADAINCEDPPEILAFGFQEVVNLEDRAVTAKSLFGFGKKKDPDTTEQHQSRVYREWRDYLIKMISRYTSASCSYAELHTSNLIGLFQCIFIRQEERPKVRDVHATSIKTGMHGRYGNKGALVTSFILDDSSLCFVNCHLAAGQTHTSHRNNDVATIMEAEKLPAMQDSESRMSLFIGGGDGSQILDHEICLLNGDLNYRIDTVPRDTVIKMIKANDLPKLLERDQIMVSRRRVTGFRLASFVELPITFEPTYKYDVGTDNYDTSEKKRAPAWCDRILYRGTGRVKQVAYRRHEVRVSDHRPVSGLFKIRIKTIDQKHRAKVKKECERLFDDMTKKLMQKMAQRYLMSEYDMRSDEAAHKIGAS